MLGLWKGSGNSLCQSEYIEFHKEVKASGLGQARLKRAPHMLILRWPRKSSSYCSTVAYCRYRAFQLYTMRRLQDLGCARDQPHTCCQRMECGISLYLREYDVVWNGPVSDLSVVHHHHRARASVLLPRRENDLPPLVATDAKGRRCKIWDIAPSLHCSIIGTCLSAAELRQFFTKLGDRCQNGIG